MTIALLLHNPKKQHGATHKLSGTRLSINVSKTSSSPPSIINARSRKCININGIYLKQGQKIFLFHLNCWSISWVKYTIAWQFHTGIQSVEQEKSSKKATKWSSASKLHSIRYRSNKSHKRKYRTFHYHTNPAERTLPFPRTLSHIETQLNEENKGK